MYDTWVDGVRQEIGLPQNMRTSRMNVEGGFQKGFFENMGVVRHEDVDMKEQKLSQDTKMIKRSQRHRGALHAGRRGAA